MRKTSGMFVLLITMSLVVAGSPVLAQNVKEHSLIRPFPGSVLAENMSKYSKFDAYEFYYFDEATKKRGKKTVQGEYWRLLYEVRTPSGDRVRTISKLEFFENYRTAAEEKGGRVVFEDVGQMVLTIPRDDGGITWLRVAGSAGLGQQDLIIIDEKPLKTSLKFGPAEMKAVLDSDGRVQLYGILFDLDKATLQDESVKQLQDVVVLLRENLELVLEVQGHTDDQGSDQYNLDLSQRRAETVVTYLGLFGIDSSRLFPKGYGESTPVLSNATEEGRAKNRRVELVKPTSPGAALNKGATGDEGQFILGTWEITPSKRVSEGSIVFNTDGTYALNERLQDGSGVGTKGEYILDGTSTPVRIDLCLGKCGKSGSEWTTRFGILKALSGETMQIRTSPDGNYPAEFSNDRSEEYTMILKRLQ